MQAFNHELEAVYRELQGNARQSKLSVTVEELMAFLKGKTMPDGSGPWNRLLSGKQKGRWQLLVDAIQVLKAGPSEASQVECYTPEWYALAFNHELEAALRELQGDRIQSMSSVPRRELLVFLKGKTMPDGSGPWNRLLSGKQKDRRQLLVDVIQVLKAGPSGSSQVECYTLEWYALAFNHELEAALRELQGDRIQSMSSVPRQELLAFLKGKTMPDGSGPWNRLLSGKQKDRRQLLVDVIQVLKAGPSGSSQVECYTPERYALAFNHELEAALRELQGDGTQSKFSVPRQELVVFLKGKTMPNGSGPWICSIRGRGKVKRQLLVDAIQVLTGAPASPSGSSQVECYAPEWYAKAFNHELEAAFRELQGDGTQSMSSVPRQELLAFLKGKTMPDGSRRWNRLLSGKQKNKRQLLLDAIQVLTGPPASLSESSQVECYTPEWYAVAFDFELEAAFRELQGDGIQSKLSVKGQELVVFLKGKIMPDGSGPWMGSIRRRKKDKRQLLVDAIQVLTGPPASPNRASQVECYTPEWYAKAFDHELKAAFRELQGDGTQPKLSVTKLELLAFLKGKTMPDGSGRWNRLLSGKMKNKRQLLVDAIQALNAGPSEASQI